MVRAGHHDGNRKWMRSQIKFLKIADPRFFRIAVRRRIDTDFALGFTLEAFLNVEVRDE